MRPALIFLLAVLVLAFIPGVSGQSSQYPNELEGYRFFGSGKLKGLQLLVSARDDVKRVFGDKCEKQCDYDADWSINVEYFDEIWTKESSNNKGDRWTYFLDSKYLGKLRVVDLRPKKSISFVNVIFPDIFQKTIVTSTSDSRSGSVVTVNNSYHDPDGLSYEFFGQTTQISVPGSVARSFRPGDLVLIRYAISKDREKSLFVLQK